MKNKRTALLIATMLAITSLVSCGKSSGTDTKIDNVSDNTSTSIEETPNNDTSTGNKEEQDTSNTGETWELKGLSCPTISLERVSVDGNRTQPVTKVKSFINISTEEIENYLNTTEFYNGFIYKTSILETIDTKSSKVGNDNNSIRDKTIKDNAFGYETYYTISGHSDDYHKKVEVETKNNTGTVEGLTTFEIKFSGDNETLKENMEAAYQLASKALPSEVADYLFFGENTMNMDKTVELGDGAYVDYWRYVEEDGHETEVTIYVRIRQNGDEYRALNDSAGYEPYKSKYSVEDLVPGTIGETDISNSLNMLSELFNPFPVQGASYGVSNVQKVNRAFHIDGETGEEETQYGFDVDAWYKDYETNGVASFDNHNIDIGLNIKNIGDEITHYEIAGEINFYAKFTEGTDESDNWAVKCTVDAIKDIFPEANPEVKTFDELNELYTYEFTTNVLGLEVPVKLTMKSHEAGNYIAASFYGIYNK